MTRLLPALCATLLWPALLPAQADGAPDPRQQAWPEAFAAGLGKPDHPMLVALRKELEGYFEASVADGAGRHSMNRMFLTPETLAALPLRVRLLRQPGKERLRSMRALMHFDHARRVDWGKVFENMRPEEVDAQQSLWRVQRMWVRELQKADGSFRMIFGDAFGLGSDQEAARKHPLLHTEYELAAGRPMLPKTTTAQLQAAPVWLSLDLNQVEEIDKEITQVMGPGVSRLGVALNLMAGRPQVDVFSGIRPGLGLVGTMLEKRPRNASLVGTLGFNADLLLNLDLGKDFTGALKTAWAAGAGQLPDAVETLLEDWSGALSLALTADAPGQAAGEDQAQAAQDRLLQSSRGSLCLRVEAGAGRDCAAAVEKLLGRMPGEAVAIEGHHAFPLPGGKWVAVSQTEELLTLGLGRDAAEAMALSRGAHASKSKIPVPHRLALVQGPLKLNVSPKLLPYTHQPLRELVAMVMRPLRDSQRMKWVQERLCGGLLRESLTLGLSWSARRGTWLRLLF